MILVCPCNQTVTLDHCYIFSSGKWNLQTEEILAEGLVFCLLMVVYKYIICAFCIVFLLLGDCFLLQSHTHSEVLYWMNR